MCSARRLFTAKSRESIPLSPRGGNAENAGQESAGLENAGVEKKSYMKYK